MWMSNIMSCFTKETCILIGTIIFLFTIYFRRKLTLFKRLNIPQVNPGFLGLNYVIQLTKDADYMFFKDDIEMKKIHGNIYGRYQFMSPIVVIWDPEILKEIYIKKFPVFPDRQKSLLKVNGEMNDSLTGISGGQWKRVRSTMTPAFSSSKLKEMLHIVADRADVLMTKLDEIVANNDGVVSPHTVIGRFAMDVISSAAFSANFNAQVGEEEPKAVKLLKDAFSAETFQNPVIVLLSLFPSLEWIFEKFDYSIFGKEYHTHINGLTEAIIKAKKNTSSSTRTDLMQQMLERQITEEEAKTATKGLTRREIVGNSSLMILAGYETTSQTMTYLLYNLAQHQEIQDRLRSEIQDSIERHENKISYDMINDVKYLMQCINESLRFYPTVPMNTRFCDHEVTIKGVTIPKGMQIQVPLHGLSHCEDFWDEPSVFNPDRMEDMSRIDPMVFQPFGGGPRNCIGMRFALMTMKLAITRIITKYRVVPCEKTVPPPLELTLSLTTTSKEEVFLKLEEI